MTLTKVTSRGHPTLAVLDIISDYIDPDKSESGVRISIQRTCCLKMLYIIGYLIYFLQERHGLRHLGLPASRDGGWEDP